MRITLPQVLAFGPCRKCRDVKDGGDGAARRWFDKRRWVRHTTVLRDTSLPAADRVWLGVHLLTPRGRQQFGADCIERRAVYTEHRVVVFEAARPGDDRPRRALEATLAVATALRGGDAAKIEAACAAARKAATAARTIYGTTYGAYGAPYAAAAADNAAATADNADDDDAAVNDADDADADADDAVDDNARAARATYGAAGAAVVATVAADAAHSARGAHGATYAAAAPADAAVVAGVERRHQIELLIALISDAAAAADNDAAVDADADADAVARTAAED